MALNESASNIIISCYFDVTPLQDKTKVCIIEMVGVFLCLIYLPFIVEGKERKRRNDRHNYLHHPSSTQRKDEPTNSPSNAYFLLRQHRSKNLGVR